MTHHMFSECLWLLITDLNLQLQVGLLPIYPFWELDMPGICLFKCSASESGISSSRSWLSPDQFKLISDSELRTKSQHVNWISVSLLREFSTAPSELTAGTSCSLSTFWNMHSDYDVAELNQPPRGLYFSKFLHLSGWDNTTSPHLWVINVVEKHCKCSILTKFFGWSKNIWVANFQTGLWHFVSLLELIVISLNTFFSSFLL